MKRSVRNCSSALRVLTLTYTAWIAAASYQFDGGTTSFSPEGRLDQVEYASQAISLSKPIMGIVTKEGAVVGALRGVLSPLLQDRGGGGDTPSSRGGGVAPFRERLHCLAPHLVCAVAGLQADATTLVRHSQEVCQGHMREFGEPMPVRRLCEALCDQLQYVTQIGGLRPFGSSFLLVGWDKEEGMQLYRTDPSGNFDSWVATSVGYESKKLNKKLEGCYDENMSLHDAKITLARLLNEVSVDLKENEQQYCWMEIGIVCESNGLVSISWLPTSEVDLLIEQAQTSAEKT
uniref:Proteasome subunit alpha type n=1 Tax=Fibrocapsa japonica TaxID=94617 RepID=A0A7S2UTK9_9STRA|mmetsp:Transcript_12816/g.18910  ORF Transcript_12816/g.18910 Transcript_12816/m.18910 type:complete len:290 (+) Transcript_12816:1-870(+)